MHRQHTGRHQMSGRHPDVRQTPDSQAEIQKAIQKSRKLDRNPENNTEIHKTRQKSRKLDRNPTGYARFWTEIITIGLNQVAVAPFGALLVQNRSHGVWEAIGMPPAP